MTLNVRSASEKPEQEDRIVATDGTQWIVTGQYQNYGIEQVETEIQDASEDLIRLPWAGITSWVLESELVEYMKSQVKEAEG